MNKTVARRIVQCLSVLIGFGGLFELFFTAHFGCSAISDKDYGILIVLPFIGIIGVYMILASYQAIWKYSSKSIKSFSAIIAIVAMVGLGDAVDPFAEHLLQAKQELLASIVRGVLPLFAAYFAYWLLSKLLIKYTLGDSVQDG